MATMNTSSSHTPLDAFERPVIAITGPTASGKSTLAQEVALRLDGEVVSADSMQIYRHMDIGTAKVLPEEQQVPHHLIDILDPGESYSASLFQEQSRAAFQDIYDRGKVPILCGGTGFYVQSSLEDMRFPDGEQDDNPLREAYETLQREQGNEALWSILNEKDPAAAALIHPNNFKRVIRAIEMHEEGISYADQVKNIKALPEAVWSLRFFLQVDPFMLADRINTRVDAMIDAGLIEEVEALQALGFEGALTAPQAIGYKEIIAAKRGEMTLERAIKQIKIATRRYAKRQRSWFRRDDRLIILDADDLTTNELADIVCEHYQAALKQGPLR
ncbi:tRNA (adenosine(37)-N6)-dimethylallyltransferase MiaA [Anaerotardibacter muris]|uniref:tRNA (adenosine(37)-N6)-dimethylallyltransferase MiaA n=1 Tax=Anaerotardibacter muris TaxID=2941505 RepID=UPI00203FC1D7|nr:tRNA (adenosine(37)-N6)-dimethylallyltransferase MiaA [Anaerotardibacter muris]